MQAARFLHITKIMPISALACEIVGKIVVSIEIDP